MSALSSRVQVYKQLFLFKIVLFFLVETASLGTFPKIVKKFWINFESSQRG